MSIPWTGIHRLAIVAAVTLAVAGFAGAQAQQPASQRQSSSSASAGAPSASVGNGQRLFTRYYCYSCHGSDGQGGAGVALVGPNLPVFSVFRSYLRKPAGTMPPYRSSAVSDAELTQIYAYLKSIPAPAPAQSIPLLNP